MTTTDRAALVERLRQRFTSGNGTPVTRAHITRDEYEWMVGDLTTDAMLEHAARKGLQALLTPAPAAKRQDWLSENAIWLALRAINRYDHPGEVREFERLRDALATKDAAPAPGVDEAVAWQWRSRVKGGAWDAWENGRYASEPAPFMDVEHRLLYTHPSPVEAAVERDAARYRFIRNPTQDVGLVIDKVVGETPMDEQGYGGYKHYEYRAGDELDQAIDAAIDAQQQESGS